MSKPKMMKRQFVLPMRLHKDLKRHALKNDVSMSEIVTNLIRRFLFQQAKK